MTTALALQSVSVDGWTAYDHPQAPVDDLGNLWIWQEITGWHGGLSPRGAPIARPFADGDHDGLAPLPGRLITLSGTLIAPARDALQRGMDQLGAVLAGPVRRADLTVDEGVIPLQRSATVRLGGPTLVERTGPVSAKWSLSLFAADPARYSQRVKQITLHTYVLGGGRTYNLTYARRYGPIGNDGVGEVTNDGNTSTAPVITFIGPSSGPVIRLVDGDRMRLAMTLEDHDTVVIDCAARTVILNGTASRRHMLTSDSRFLLFPPGRSQLLYTVDFAVGGPCLVSWRDAWA